MREDWRLWREENVHCNRFFSDCECAWMEANLSDRRIANASFDRQKLCRSTRSMMLAPLVDFVDGAVVWSGRFVVDERRCVLGRKDGKGGKVRREE
jgi:hypothetical protein